MSDLEINVSDEIKSRAVFGNTGDPRGRRIFVRVPRGLSRIERDNYIRNEINRIREGNNKDG